MGSLADDASFDPTMLSGVVVQVKYKSTADTAAERYVRPLGIIRNRDAPLPYLAFLMELGTESTHGHSGKNVKSAVWSNDNNKTFSQHLQDWTNAVDDLEKSKGEKESTRKKLRSQMEAKRAAVDGYNRYTISASGVSGVYGVLTEINAEAALQALLKATLPPPSEHSPLVQQMRPLERTGDTSAHTDWMQQYVGEQFDNMDTSG